VTQVRVLDEANRVAQVIVPDYQLSLAIGKEGQNVRLAARLTGWRIDIQPDNQVGADQQAGQPSQRRETGRKVADKVPGAADAPAL
jgi:N utilization substance protein A